MTIEHMQVFPCANGFKAAVVGASGTVSDVVFGGTDSTTTWIIGVQVGGAASGLVSSIRFNNVIVSAETPFSDAGWVIESGSDGFNCVQCGAQRNGNDIKGMHIRNTAGGSAPSNIMISNTGMECGPTKDCLTIDAVGLNVTVDSSIISAGLRNVVFNGGKSFHIANSTIVLAQQEGVILTAQPTGEFSISTSTISDSSNATNNTSANFKANANIGNFKLIGNTFKQTLAAPPANLPVNDVLLAAGTGNNITIRDNTLSNNVTAPMSNGATGLANIIERNTPNSATANPSNANGFSYAKATAVTVNANVTTDQNLMAFSLAPGALNAIDKLIHVAGSGIYTTLTSAPTVTLKVKLCTVSGCGSGTVITACSWTTQATTAAVTNSWYIDNCDIGTISAGATGTVIGKGRADVQIGATAGVRAPEIDVETNNAASAAVDLTAALFVQISITFSVNQAGAHTGKEWLGSATVVN
jgi:hypothetical protein